MDKKENIPADSLDSPIRIFVRGSFTTVIGTIVVGVINYLTRRTMALSLDQELYGFFYSAFSLCMLVVIFIDLGFNQSAVLLISKHSAQEKFASVRSTFWTFISTKFVTGALSAILLMVASEFLIQHFFRYPSGLPMLRLFSLFLVATALTGIIFGTLESFKKFTSRNIIQTGGVLFVFIGVYTFIEKYPLQAPVISYTVSALLLFVFGISYLRFSKPFLFQRKPRLELGKSFREFWNVGKWITVATAGMSVMYYMDTVMLTILSDLESVANYNVALPILAIYQGLLIFPLIFTPIASELWHKGKKRELKRAIKKIESVGIVVLTGCIVIIFYFPVNEMVVSLLFSPDFKLVAPALNILCVGILVLGLGQMYSNTLMSIDKPKSVALIVLIAVVVNIFANILLIPRFNIVGAAVATTTSYILLSVSSWRILRTSLARVS